NHSVGQSITGGYIYRGSLLGSTFSGRYFFADFVASRVWSLGLSLNPTTGEATAVDLREHTAELGGGAVLNGVSSFGVDLNGELYIVSRGNGQVLRLKPQTTSPLMFIDTPTQGAVLRQPFLFSGWAFDGAAQVGTGIDTVHVWAFPTSGAPGMFVGVATYGASRPDVGAVFGSQFTPSGFGLNISGLSPGSYRLMGFGRV